MSPAVRRSQRSGGGGPAGGAPAAAGGGPPWPRPGPPPRGGAVSAAAVVAASSTFAMKTPALFCSMPAPYDQCSCQMSSRPGDDRIVVIAERAAPLRVPFCITATRGCTACTSCGDPDGSVPWCDTRYRSIVPIGLVGHIRSCSLFQSRSARSIARNWPNVATVPSDWAFSGSVVMSFGVNCAHAGFALPPPGSGVFSTLPADVTTRQSKPVMGILSPGLTTMCFALPYSSAYAAWKPCTCSRSSTDGPWSTKVAIGIRFASSCRPPT